MSGKLSPVAQQKLATLDIYTPRVLRLNAMIEEFAVAKTNVENINMTIKRAAAALKLQYMTAGLEAMAQCCAMVWLTAHRGGTQSFRARNFREHIGNLKFQIDLEIRTIMREDQERQMKSQGGGA